MKLDHGKHCQTILTAGRLKKHYFNIHVSRKDQFSMFTMCTSTIQQLKQFMFE